MELSRRAQETKPNILTQLEHLVRERRAAGLPVYNLSIGTPDFPPDFHVREAVSRAALEPAQYRYSIADSPPLVEAVQGWYERRFGVSLAKGEISSVYGTQEGMAHIFFTLCNPGDLVLLPQPLYPIFLTGTLLAGAVPYYLPMTPENGYLIDLDSIDPAVAAKAKVLVVSYPNNPTTATAPPEFYEKLIWFAKKYEIFVIHDNAYGELVLEGPQPNSFLSYPGAKEIGMEFNSLSKSYNLTGARLSFALGNQQVLSAFRDFRSQIDYGMFYPTEKGAIAALNGPQEILERNRVGYRTRRDALVEGLREGGWAVPRCTSTMFTWFPLPKKGTQDDAVFALELAEKTGVICVPGTGFGPLGAGYVRMALTLPEEQMTKAAKAVAASGMLD